MARSIPISFYNSRAWHKCKNRYLTKVNHLCERCLEKGIYEPAVIVHHKIHLTAENYGDAELMFGFDNLMALCIPCHNEIHGHKHEERRWKFIDGELVTRN